MRSAPVPPWNVEPHVAVILQHIQSLDYFVGIYRDLQRPGYVKMQAMYMGGYPAQVFMAAVDANEDGDTNYRCACLLAEMVGIDLEDG